LTHLLHRHGSAHEFTTANVYDSEAVPHLLNQLTGFEIGFALGDKAYDSKRIRERAKEQDILFLVPLNNRKGGKRKESFARVMLTFLKSTSRSVIRKKRRFFSKQPSIVYPNHLARQFKAEALNQKWVTDITYLPFQNQFLHLSAIQVYITIK
jgi:transposase InsO family protein